MTEQAFTFDDAACEKAARHNLPDWAPPEPPHSELAKWVAWYCAMFPNPTGAVLELAERLEKLEKAARD